MPNPHESSRSTSAAGKPAPAPPRPLSVAAVGLLMIGAFLLISAFVGRLEAKPPAPPAAPAPTAETPPAPAPSDALADPSKALKSQLDELASQLKTLQGKVEGLPRPQIAPDLKPLEDSVSALTKSVALVTPLTEKLDKLDARVAEAEAAAQSAKSALTTLSSEVSGYASEAKKHDDAKRVETPAVGPAAARDDATPTLSDGAALFKAGKFADAGEVFKKVESAHPNDARVYYFLAFVNGITTKEWQGETLKIAAKGAALEKAGQTKPADIDAAFSDLPANLKSWLSYFRNQTP